MKDIAGNSSSSSPVLVREASLLKLMGGTNALLKEKQQRCSPDLGRSLLKSVTYANADHAAN